MWPVRWELPKDCDLDPACRALDPAQRTPDYHTGGLDQGSQLHWPTLSPALPVAENAVAPALPDEDTHHAAAPVWVRPRERAVHFEGTIDARATGVVIQMFDRNGNVAQLRPNIDPRVATVNQVPGTVSAPAGATRPYSVEIFLADAVNTFGPVQLFVQSTGMMPPSVEAFTGYLCGFQIALVDDFMANPDGLHRGPLLNEANEKLTVDFINSPFTATLPSHNQARLRRMNHFLLNSRDRPLDASTPVSAANPRIFRPEMPMWMAEFHAVGVSPVPLTTVMALRAHFEGAPFDLTLALTWETKLSWDGPDHLTDRHHYYEYEIVLPQQQTVRMHYNRAGHFADATGTDVVLTDGELLSAFDPAPTALTFPVAGRRLPKVLVSGQQRAWGRARTAVTKDSWVIECQLKIVRMRGADEVELFRGGDGRLRLDMTMDTVDLVQAPETAPAMRLPCFRIRGQNPTAAQATAIRDAVVNEFVRVHAADAWVQLLTATEWRETARLVFQHEAGGLQFDLRPSQVRFLGHGIDLYYGSENGMPFFGGPHGYGFVQVDYGENAVGTGDEHVPTVDELHDELWNVVDCIRGGVRHLVNVKGHGAFRFLSGHMLADQRRMQAVFQRETVRRYNGGTEFVFHAGDWMIQPSIKWTNSHHHHKGAAQGMLYCNAVLNTAIVYFTGNGNNNNFIARVPASNSVADQAAADTAVDSQMTFPWPIAFLVTDYGPGI